MFSTLPKLIFNFELTFILSSANAFNLDESIILSFGKELFRVFMCQKVCGEKMLLSLSIQSQYFTVLRRLLKTLLLKEKILVCSILDVNCPEEISFAEPDVCMLFSARAFSGRFA